MTPKDHPVWNKMAVPTLDTLEEAMREVKRREKIEEWRRLCQVPHTKCAVPKAIAGYTPPIKTNNF